MLPRISCVVPVLAEFFHGAVWLREVQWFLPWRLRQKLTACVTLGTSLNLFSHLKRTLKELIS